MGLNPIQKQCKERENNIEMSSLQTIKQVGKDRATKQIKTVAYHFKVGGKTAGKMMQKMKERGSWREWEVNI